MKISKPQLAITLSTVVLLLSMQQAQAATMDTVTFNFRDDPGLLPGGPNFPPGLTKFTDSSIQIGDYVFASVDWGYWSFNRSGDNQSGIRINPPPATTNASLEVYRKDGAQFDLNSFRVHLGGANLGDNNSNFDVISCTDSNCNTLNTVSFAGLSNFGNDLSKTPNIVGNTYKITLDYAIAYNLQNITLSSAVPLPASIWLFGSTLAGLVMTKRRSKIRFSIKSRNKNYPD
jgi:hypothetical protein